MLIGENLVYSGVSSWVYIAADPIDAVKVLSAQYTHTVAANYNH